MCLCAWNLCKRRRAENDTSTQGLWDREGGGIVDGYSKTGEKELGGEKRSSF